MSEPVRPLFGRVTPYDGETLLSIISRSAEANVHVRLGAFLRLAGINTLTPSYVPFTKMESMGPLAQRLGIALHETLKRTHPKVSGDVGAWIDWYGTPLLRSFVDADSYRFSPSALKRDGFQRAQWMIRPLTFCPETMELLVDQCTCGRAQRWQYRSDMRHCEKCHAPLTNVSTTHVTAHLRDGARAACAFVSPKKSQRRDALQSLPKPFCDWEAGEAFSAIVELGCIAGNVPDMNLAYKARRGDFGSYTVEHIVAGLRFVREWPDSLSRLLGETVDVERSCSLRTCTGPLVRYFGTGAARTKLCLLVRSSVPQALSDLMLRPSGSRSKNAEWLHSTGAISQNSASIKYKIDKKILRRLDNAARDGKIVESICGKNLYDESRLASCIRAFRDGKTSLRISQVVGVPEYCVSAVAEACGILRLDDGDAEVLAAGELYEGSSLDLVLNALRDTPGTEFQEAVPLREILRGRFHPADWACAVNALISKSLRFSPVLSERGINLATFEVERHDALKFLGKLPKRAIPGDILVSIETAAMLLGVKSAALGRGVSDGLLPASCRRGPAVMVALTAVAEFDRKYFTGEEARWRLGMDGRELGTLLRRANCTPAARMSTTPVWSRRDVEEVTGVCFKRSLAARCALGL